MARQMQAITRQLLHTQPHELPNLIPYLTGPLNECHEVFSRNQKAGPHLSLVHTFQKQVKALLWAKDQESVWAAVILIKGTVEIVSRESGELESLESEGRWIQRLLGLLKVDQYMF